MNDLTDGARRGWYDLGKYSILAMPLQTNEYFTTHHIFIANRLIGRQLSVPSLSDCQWHENRAGVYATKEQSHKPRYGYQMLPSRPRGRPTNAERARRAATELAEVPE